MTTNFTAPRPTLRGGNIQHPRELKNEEGYCHPEAKHRHSREDGDDAEEAANKKAQEMEMIKQRQDEDALEAGCEAKGERA